MIQNRSKIRTDSQGQELDEDRLVLFDLTVNDGDIHQYLASCIPSHWHRQLEIFLLLSGSIQISAGDSVYHLNAGEGCFFNTEVIHSFAGLAPSPCSYRSFVFDPGIVGGTPGSIFDTKYVRPLLEKGAPFIRFSPESDSPYFKQFHQAFSACENELPGYEFKVRNALSSILLYVIEKSEVVPVRKIPAVQETRLKQMLVWLKQNAEQTISVTEIAAAANICPRECQRIFRQYLNCTPTEYIQQLRIFSAAEQLAATDTPITAVALACGFSSPSYFSKQFKARVGCTPLEYRSAVRSKQLSEI